jgi:ATP-binding cassette, subfamily B, bacterial
MATASVLSLRVRHVWHLARALRLVWHSSPGWMAASVGLLVLQGLLPLVTLYLVKLVIDAVASAQATTGTSPAFARVAFLIALAGAATLLGEVCRAVARVASEAQALSVTDRMHELLHAKSIEVDLAYYENSQYYDTLHRAQQEAPFRPTRIVHGLLQVGRSGISMAAMVGLLFSFHWGIALIICAAVVPGLFVHVRHAGHFFRWSRQRTPTERRARYWNWLLTTDGHAKEIRLFALGPLFMRRYREVRQQLRRERLDLTTQQTRAELLAQASSSLAVFGAYAFIAYRAVHEAITLGDVIMYFQAFQRGQGFLREMLGGLAGLYEDSLFLSSLYEFLDLQWTVIEPVHPHPVPRPLQTGIVFRHVSFRYPNNRRTVLHDITLTIRPGEVVAFVGENGSGKTTLIKLLCCL